jgi:hypothetical protein
MKSNPNIPGRNHKLNADEFRSFVFQGKAAFTLENKETGNYVVYRIQSKKRKRNQPEERRLFDVYVRALGDGWRGNRYIGQVDRKTGILKTTYGSDPNSVGIRTFNWLINKWKRLDQFEDKMNMYHMGICCKCGRDLTVPESIENGIGPQCKHYREDKTLKMIADLGIVTKGRKYDEVIVEAIHKFPEIIEDIYVPGEIRKNDEFMQVLDVAGDFGLI